MDPAARRPLAFLLAVFLLFAGAVSSGVAQAPDATQVGHALPHPDLSTPADTTKKDAPFVPTPRDVVVEMMSVADVSADDVVFDLGSGDGRIPIIAAEEFGARGVGVEIDPELVAQSRDRAQEAGVSERVEFKQGDLFEADLSEATVVALYLWPEINLKLRPKLLRELDPGDRIVSHDFKMGEWEPDRRIDMGKGMTGKDVVYLWTVPEEVPDRLMQVPDEYTKGTPEQ